MGSIEAYQTDRGKRYRVRYRDPEHAQRLRAGFETKHSAEEFLAAITVSKSRGEYVDPADARVTLSALAAEWLENQSHLKPSSARPLEIAWRRQVAPRWANVRISDVRFSNVQAWVTQLSAERSASTVIRAYGVLAALLDVAVRDRRILSNPARGVKLPRKVGKEKVYLTHEQVDLLATNAGDHGTLVLFLAYTGLRWGEVTALRVSSLDSLRRRVNVTRNAVMVGGTIHEGTPKSHEARSVPFPAFLSERLAKVCEGKSRDDLLFGDGHTFLRPPDVRNGWWVRALTAARERDATFPQSITRHDLRHTAASLSVSAGANVKAVQRMLGHASAAMTLDVYAELFDDDLDAVAVALDRARSEKSVHFLLTLPKSANGKTP
ncbi:MAG TPA: site-specific integrase [Galbitalea sp.]|jgi:integrase|nr:site-specific integrase [Galbitalea sp.]